jgi:hypothetical protein
VVLGPMLVKIQECCTPRTPRHLAQLKGASLPAQISLEMAGVTPIPMTCLGHIIILKLVAGMVETVAW